MTRIVRLYGTPSVPFVNVFVCNSGETATGNVLVTVFRSASVTVI